MLRIQHSILALFPCLQLLASGPHAATSWRALTELGMLKIEKDSGDQVTLIRLIGRIESEHLEELKTQIVGEGSDVVLNLDDVTLVDLAVIRFLNVCESQGVQLVEASPYIREWMLREREPGTAL
jgi:hypothetical protein